jgi:hypothetical protein
MMTTVPEFVNILYAHCPISEDAENLRRSATPRWSGSVVGRLG